MQGSEFPPVAEILPHEGSMVLLSSVLRHQRDRTVCEVDIDDQSLLRSPEGGVGVWIGLEYMAQCIAAHGGLVARADGERPRVGFLLGSRRVTFYTSHFSKGQKLEVTADRVWSGARGMVSFDCSIADRATGALLVEGRLTCFMPREGDDLEGLE